MSGYFFNRYVNFPISAVRGMMDEPRPSLTRILMWHFYEKAKGRQVKDALEAIKTVLHDEGWRRPDDEDLYEFYQRCGEVYGQYKGAMVGLPLAKMKDLVDSLERMPEAEKVLLLAFLAAKSILGRKVYTRVDYFYLFARMNGRAKPYTSETELLAECHPTIAKYYTRRKCITLRRRLEQAYHIASYSNHHRGFFISSKLGYEDLIRAVESKKETATMYDNRRRKARDKVIASLASEDAVANDHLDL